MKDNLYYDEERKFEPLIKLLKELPKVDAPDNFEYNLMVKIKNGNLEKKEPKTFSKWLYIFTPAAVTVSIILLFFVLTGNENGDYFFLEKPQKITSSSKTSDTIKIQEFVVNNAGIGENKEKSNVKIEKKTYAVVVQNNDVVKKSNKSFILDDSKSLDLDKIISGEQVISENNSRVRLVSDGNNLYPFDEYLVKPNKKEDVTKLKARMDSLKKAANKKSK